MSSFYCFLLNPQNEWGESGLWGQCFFASLASTTLHIPGLLLWHFPQTSNSLQRRKIKLRSKACIIFLLRGRETFLKQPTSQELFQSPCSYCGQWAGSQEGTCISSAVSNDCRGLASVAKKTNHLAASRDSAPWDSHQRSGAACPSPYRLHRIGAHMYLV
jgi:hypothetical protein